MSDFATLPIAGQNIYKTFRLGTGEVVRALDCISLQARHGTLTALVQPALRRQGQGHGGKDNSPPESLCDWWG